MRTRKFGRLDFEVSELGLGTWGLSGDGYGPVAEREQDAVIDRARALGFTLFDTADSYARGAMERKLGERLPDDGSSVIVTKIGSDLESYPNRKRFDVPFLREAFERCRERQRRNKLDVVLLHNPSRRVVERGEAAAFLESRVQAGELTAWGISLGDPECAYAAVQQAVKPHVVEVAYNAFCSTDVSNFGPALGVAGVALLARSVLAHGLLAGFWSPDKTFEAYDHRAHRWTRDQFRRRLNQLRAFSGIDRSRVPSSRAAAIDFVLNNSLIASAILGPRDVVQLDQLYREVAKQPPYLHVNDREKLLHQLSELGC